MSFEWNLVCIVDDIEVMAVAGTCGLGTACYFIWGSQLDITRLFLEVTRTIS